MSWKTDSVLHNNSAYVLEQYSNSREIEEYRVNINTLPVDMMNLIFSYLGIKDFSVLSLVSFS